VGALKQRGHYARRIEDQFAVGVLDIITVFKIDEKIWFIEAKIINGNYFGMTERQYVEAQRLTKTANTGVATCLVGYKEAEKKWYVSAPSTKVHVDDCLQQGDGELFETLLMRWRNLQ